MQAGGDLGDAAPCGRVRNVQLDRWEQDLLDGGSQSRMSGGVPGRIDDSRVDVAVVRLVEPVDNVALDVGMEYVDLDAELFGVLRDRAVIVFEGMRAEPLHLRLSAHVHARAVDYQNLGQGYSLP